MFGSPRKSEGRRGCTQARPAGPLTIRWRRYLRAALAYILISMPTQIIAIDGVFQGKRTMMTPGLFLAIQACFIEPHVRRQRPWDRLGGLNKRGFLAHLNPRGIEDETEHQSPESIGREGREGHPAGRLVGSSAPKRRSGSFWRACAARTVSLSCVAVRGSTRTSITAGRRTSWRPGRSAWRVTLPVRLPPMRSGIFAVRHWHSRRPLLT